MTKFLADKIFPQRRNINALIIFLFILLIKSSKKQIYFNSAEPVICPPNCKFTKYITMCRYLSWIMKSPQGEIWKGTSSRYRQIDVPLYRSPPSHAPSATTQEIRKRDRGRAKGSRVRGVLCTIKQTEREK